MCLPATDAKSIIKMKNNQILRGAEAEQFWAASVKRLLSPVVLCSSALHSKEINENGKQHRTKTKSINYGALLGNPNTAPCWLDPRVTFQSGAGSQCCAVFCYVLFTGSRSRKPIELRWEWCWELTAEQVAKGRMHRGWLRKFGKL